MYTPLLAFVPPRSALLARALVVVAPILLADALAAAAGADSDLPGAGTAVALVAGGYSALLIRRAWRTHRAAAAATPATVSGALSVALSATRCRSAGMLGVGFGVAALTCLADAVAYSAGASLRTVAHLTVGGLALAMVAFLPALILMPGAAADPVARIRRALDGVSVGICLLFTSWVLVIAPKGRIDSVGFWTAILTCCGLAFAVISALRSRGARRCAAACAGGVAAAIIGLDGVAFSLTNNFSVFWPSFFAAGIAAGAGLAWYGARHLAEPDDTPPPEPRATFAVYPVLALPAAVAIAVALHRLVTGGPFDRPSVLLGVVGIVVIAVRETLGALDVSRYAKQIERQEAQFRNLVAGSTDVIMVLDDDLVVRWQSPASARQFGLSDQDVVGRHFAAMLHPADAVIVAQRLADVRTGVGGLGAGEHPALVEARLRDGFGQWRETESSISDQREVPEVAGIVVHIRDIGERKEMERTLHWLAHADTLTGLANRRQLLLTIQGLRTNRRGARGALLLLELDGFTAVNDVRGYDIGDAVLVEVARRLRAGTGETDLPARLSGDEFAVVSEVAPVAAYALATRLVTMLAEPIALPGTTVRLTASVGVAEIARGSSSDDVLRRADLALRRAKQHGRGRVEWYDEDVERALVRRMTLEQELPGALERGELDLLYQPILDLVAGRPLGVEALLRWRHPRLGTLLPAEVIPVAEELGLITDIGVWVLDQATKQLSCWLREGRDLSMGVNVSPRQLGGDLPSAVKQVLATHCVPAERLVIELAEGGLGRDAEAAGRHLGDLRSLGVRTALDEFGTGVESLTHLRRLPVDMVKVGRTFFADTSGPPGQTVPIIDVMVGLGRRLGIDVVAQGLEAPDHLELVRSAGCRLGQGHLFAHPQPAERLEAYLNGFPTR